MVNNSEAFIVNIYKLKLRLPREKSKLCFSMFAIILKLLAKTRFETATRGLATAIGMMQGSQAWGNPQ